MQTSRLALCAALLLLLHPRVAAHADIAHDRPHGHAHGHDHAHDHAHAHDHTHSHAHSHDHTHDHAHAHGHTHTDDHNHAHAHVQSGTASFAQALTTRLQSLLHPLHTLPPATAALTASLLISSLSLTSLLLLPLSPFLPLLLPFAVGALLADLFYHLLPHVYLHATAQTAPTLLLSVAIFALLDAVIRRMHPASHAAPAYINLAADALHNFCDGLALAAAFLASPAAGVATTVAIALHEIPQEIADFAVLLRAGFSKPRAVMANLACAATAMVGTAVALFAAGLVDKADYLVLPFAAGALLYMTFATVVPDVMEEIVRPEKGDEKEDGGLVPWGTFLKRVVVAFVAAAGGVFVVGLVESTHQH